MITPHPPGSATARRASRTTATRALSIPFGPTGQLPTEFRLFTAGWNETENGRFLFDDVAAKATMAAHEAWGVDLMIDLEHQALVADIPPEPNARDARGWCQLELRPDGSLWAVNVTWTPDGAQRLTEKRQRYVSPAFSVDPETSRVTSIINVAIVAIPATHDTPALVAASARGDTGMDPKLVQQALDALIAGDDAKAAEILKGLVASAAGADPDAATEDAPPPAGDGGADEATEMAAEPEKKEELVAAGAILRLTGASSFVGALAEVETFRTSHLTLETERQKLAAERKTLEDAERRKLCVELVTLGAEFPSTVWADDKATALKPRWLKMDLVELRAHASEQRAARGGRSAPRPPALASHVAGGTDAHGLTEDQLRICKDTGCDPAVFAMLKARIAPTTTT